MPTITNPGVIKALVRAFMLNNRDEGAAMREIGYTNGYSTNGHCAKLFARSDVKAELKRQEIELIKKTGYSKAEAQHELEQARELAMQINQPSAAVSASNTKMRLHGMDQVESHRESTIIVINPPSNVKKTDCEVIENEM